jgi:hypothetical protein
METMNDPHCVRIRHREYIGEVNFGVANAFSTQEFSVNPGLSATFPWLSQIARLYEFYKFHGLAFEFVSDTSTYSSNPGMGTVIMSAEYNMFHSTYASKVEMENSSYAISARPDTSMVYGIECASNMQNQYLVRGTTSAAPISSTDFVKFVIAVQSAIPSGTSLGELWVVYDVELSRPFISYTANPTAPFSYAHVAIPNISTQIVSGQVIASIANTLSSANYVITLPNSISVTQAFPFNIDNVPLWEVLCVTVYARQTTSAAQTPFTPNVLASGTNNAVALATYCNNTSGGSQYQQDVQGRMPNSATGTTANSFGYTQFIQAQWAGPSSVASIIAGFSSANGSGVNANIDIIVTRVYNPGYAISVF